jgi:hydroxymethylbilane synthase
MRIRLGTRGSQLALFQARSVAQLLLRSGVACEIVVVKTSGDRLAEAPLSQIGGKRLFVKEIEDALLAGEIDAAVHSSKDMPAALPVGLEIGAVLPRDDPHDAIVLPGTAGAVSSLEAIEAHLGKEPRIGTSSVRRTAQLIRLFPGARFTPVRGNLDTRLRKLDSGEFDALVLAAAGLRRLQQAHRISELVPVEACIPAPGQGIIAVEVPSQTEMKGALAAINDEAARAALDAERAVVTRLGGGCQMPIGAHAVLSEHDLAITAVVLSLDGARSIRGSARGSIPDAHHIGIQAADQLLAQGAAEMLADVQRSQVTVEGLQP